MALRQIEIVIPDRHWSVAAGIFERFAVQRFWTERNAGGLARVKLILPAGETEAVLDALERQFVDLPEFRIAIVAVEAAIPREEPPPEPADVAEGQSPPRLRFGRVAREELYADVADGAHLSGLFVVMVVLSTLVAAIGLTRDNVAIIIGAMVIAPLLGPNVGLALATALADRALAGRALASSAVGYAAALAIALAWGVVTPADRNLSEIVSRTHVEIGDVVLALVSGTAGALAFTAGGSSSLIGVMVAVALLPPLVTFGLLLAGGHLPAASGALLLFTTNVICVNLSGVLVFLVQGIRPLHGSESVRARRVTRSALALWLTLLAALAGFLLYRA